MKKVKIRLDSTGDVKEFIAVANDVPFDLQVGEGRYVVDGKSIMGLFSLDLNKSVFVSYDADDAAKHPEGETKFLDGISKWRVED